MPHFRSLPDPDISLREARDFILGSELGRRALEVAWPKFPLFLSDLLETTHRLVQSCHLPEFTDHGLPHLCSLVDRISRWELGGSDDTVLLPHELEAEESATLLVGTLIHDLGMLSQNAADLPADAADSKAKGHWANPADWVRSTHVDRLPDLLQRLFKDTEHSAFISGADFRCCVDVAQAHQKWPHEWDGNWCRDRRMRGIAAVIAVADLLDEDSARCDTRTLIQHREGNELNRAHWLRHSLSQNRVLIEKGRIRVEMVCPADCALSRTLKPVYSALRNHFRLIGLYDDDLSSIHAGITNIEFNPSTGVPEIVENELVGWHEIPGFPNHRALCVQLLRTFMPLALKDDRKCTADDLNNIRKHSLEDVDLTLLIEAEGRTEPRSSIEETFHAIVGSR